MLETKKKRPLLRNRRRGFTFLEIMFVVVIIGVLLALVGPRIAGRSQKAKITATQQQIANLEQGIKTFELDNGAFPEKLEDIVNDTGDDSWDGPYLAKEDLPQDAWNNDFNYKVPGDENEFSFDLWSNGPNGTNDRGDQDDIVNWKKDSN